MAYENKSALAYETLNPALDRLLDNTHIQAHSADDNDMFGTFNVWQILICIKLYRFLKSTTRIKLLPGILYPI